MSDTLVIAAAYAEWQMVKSRGVLVLKFEVPLEQSERVMTILGVPLPNSERWFAIAPLIDGAIQETVKTLPGADKALRQCHALSKEFKFQGWIVSHPVYGIRGERLDSSSVRSCILDYCEIGTRGDLLTNRQALNRWYQIVADFRKETGISPD